MSSIMRWRNGLSNSTTGTGIAYDELRGSVQLMRKMKSRVIPVVMLSSKMMKTKKFGLKAGPYFEVKEWREFGGSDVKAIAADPLPGAPVAKPTTAEIVQDEIPDHHPAAKADPTIGKVRPSRKRPASMPEDHSDPIPF